MRQILETATVNTRTLAQWAGVSYETARSWRIERRSPSREAKRRLAVGLRRHARRLVKLADKLDR